MVDGVRYVSSTGNSFDLDDPEIISVQAGLPLRSRSWSYSLAGHSLLSASRSARTVELSVLFNDVAEFDRFMLNADADLVTGSPGVLYALGEPNEWWTQRAVLVSSDPQSHHLLTDAEITLTFLLLDGVWSHEGETTVGAINVDESEEWLDLPTDTPFDLMSLRRNVTFTNPLPYPVKFKMIIYGAVENPTLTIGDNTYEVDTYVPEGGYLTINSSDSTVILTTQDGGTSNLFSDAVRGDGVGSGTYIFERLPVGTNVCEWDGSFGFDLIPILERSEPPWTTSA